jgi:hypothetical protein
MASSESFGFRIGRDRDYYRDRDDYRGPGAASCEHDRGLHRGWYIIMATEPQSLSVTTLGGLIENGLFVGAIFRLKILS